MAKAKTTIDLLIREEEKTGFPNQNHQVWFKDDGRSEQVQSYVNEILEFLGVINWETRGFKHEENPDPEHPFALVFDAISLIKADVDSLLLDQQRVEKALRQSEERYMKLYEEAKKAEEVYRSLLHTSADAIVMYDLEDHVTYLSPAFSQIFGWTLDELEGQRLSFVPESEKQKTMAGVKEVIEGGDPIQGFETKRYTKEGRLIDVNISMSRYNDHEGKPAGMLVTLRDTSGRKGLEAKLQQAQKMEAIGTLAGGIAHNFNNLLMSVQGYVSLILLETEPNDPHFTMLKNIEKQIQSGSKLTNQLLEYAREGQCEIRLFNTNHLVSGISETFQVARKDIRMHLDLHEKLHSVEGDYGQIEQVMMNLYVNAADAMPDGGDLFILTGNVSHLEMEGKSYSPKPGEYVMLEVRDTGVGMDEETMERIFEPFFTTKGLVKGTGLGLASVYGIVKSHGGYIDVDSEKGRGTTFSIYLPALNQQEEGDDEEQKGFIGGEETLLLVDDEDMLIDVGRQILENMGYRVIVAQSGKEALDVYSREREGIAMVILDMIMPDMSGIDTYSRLRDLNPGIKVLLSSGYNLDGQASEIMKMGCDGFIQKPFSLNDLSSKIRGILGENGQDH